MTVPSWLAAIQARNADRTQEPWIFVQRAGNEGEIISVCDFGAGSGYNQSHGSAPDVNDLNFIINAANGDMTTLIRACEVMYQALAKIEAGATYSPELMMGIAKGTIVQVNTLKQVVEREAYNATTRAHERVEEFIRRGQRG